MNLSQIRAAADKYSDLEDIRHVLSLQDLLKMVAVCERAVAWPDPQKHINTATHVGMVDDALRQAVRALED